MFDTYVDVYNEDMARLIRSYEQWYPTLFEQMTKCVQTGDNVLLIDLDDGTKLEYDAHEHTIRDVSRVYIREDNESIDEETWRREFGHRLRRAIADVGITQDHLSEMTGISRQMLSRYVKGTSTPSGYILSRLSDVLNCDVSSLTRFGYVED